MAKWAQEPKTFNSQSDVLITLPHYPQVSRHDMDDY